jgi:hypothetical protein
LHKLAHYFCDTFRPRSRHPSVTSSIPTTTTFPSLQPSLRLVPPSKDFSAYGLLPSHSYLVCSFRDFLCCMIMNRDLYSSPSSAPCTARLQNLSVPIPSLPISTFAASLEYVPLGRRGLLSSELCSLGKWFRLPTTDSSYSLPKMESHLGATAATATQSAHLEATPYDKSSTLRSKPTPLHSIQHIGHPRQNLLPRLPKDARRQRRASSESNSDTLSMRESIIPSRYHSKSCGLDEQVTPPSIGIV